MLLDKDPDDLDISLCLRECPQDATLVAVMQGLPAFAQARPELRVGGVQVRVNLSDTSKDKNVDTAMVCVRVGGEKVEVDLMPTIGEETYDASDRVPLRDTRGTAEQA